MAEVPTIWLYTGPTLHVRIVKDDERAVLPYILQVRENATKNWAPTYSSSNQTDIINKFNKLVFAATAGEIEPAPPETEPPDLPAA